MASRKPCAQCRYSYTAVRISFLDHASGIVDMNRIKSFFSLDVKPGRTTVARCA